MKRQLAKSRAALLFIVSACFCSCFTSTTSGQRFNQVPGLYDTSDVLRPIQGERDFADLVAPGGAANHSAPASNGTHDAANPKTHGSALSLDKQQVSLVQFYMATCPDCQGFSPYFKRFVSDIGAHWKQLMNIYVVNCNDDANIHLCWGQNSELTVPLLRWYSFPYLLGAMSQESLSSPFNAANAQVLGLTWTHRQKIYKQRRDLISLRHGTLDFMSAQLRRLRDSTLNNPPLKWQLLEPLKRQSELRKRVTSCLLLSNQNQNNNSINNPIDNKVENLLIYLRPGFAQDSYAIRTVIADWSNHTSCSSPLDSQLHGALFMIHYVEPTHTNVHNSHDDLDQSPVTLEHWSYKWDGHDAKLSSREPVSFNHHHSLFAANNKHASSFDDALDLLESQANSSNNSSSSSMDPIQQPHAAHNHAHRHAHHHHQHEKAQRARRNAIMELLAQSSQQLRAKRAHQNQTTTMTHQMDPSNHAISTRSPSGPAQTTTAPQSGNLSTVTNGQNGSQQADLALVQQQLVAENINWAPAELYPGEELLRWSLNKRIHELVASWFGAQRAASIPVLGSEAGNPGQIIQASRTIDPNLVVQPKEDDLTPLRLTDYYKILAQIVTKNILSKQVVDGFQLLGSTCMLHELSRRFPFQGGRQAGVKSAARTYVDLVHIEYLAILNKHLKQQAPISKTSLNCSQSGAFNFDEPMKQRLSSLKIPTSELELKQADIRKDHDVGLPNERHFAWQYCRGSKDYLRGHTCSLWILFHTMTVDEYLNGHHHHNNQQAGVLSNHTTIGPMNPGPAATANHITTAPNNNNHHHQHHHTHPNSTTNDIYEYKIDYVKNKLRAKCDPRNPEEALLASSTRELFVDGSKFALSNIINFVRYYMGCTNCASHFSCMVRHSDLDFDSPRPADHLLWLWEAHNRVNLRTKNTHSEDSTRPKHIFPTYEACPECYAEKPADLITGGGRLENIKFHRQPLIDFLVARYRRSAILNNKIRIEDLFRKPISDNNHGHNESSNNLNNNHTTTDAPASKVVGLTTNSSGTPSHNTIIPARLSSHVIKS